MSKIDCVALVISSTAKQTLECVPYAIYIMAQVLASIKRMFL